MKKIITLALIIICVAQNISANQTMLYNALLNNSTAEICAAVKLGADVNVPIYHKSPLFIAISFGHFDAVKCLLEYGAQSTPELSELALTKGDAKSSILLFTYYDTKLSHLDSVLIEEGLIVHLDFESIVSLIKRSPDFALCISRSSRIMQYIINKIDDSKAFSELIQQILDSGYNVNDLWSLLLFTQDINITALKLIIEKGADINITFEDEDKYCCSCWTPLLAAIALDNEETVRILLDADADINKSEYLFEKDCSCVFHGQHSPLELAIKKNNKFIIKLLIEHGACI